MAKDNKRYSNLNACCPGGLTCCNGWGCNPRNMKHLVRRKLRRLEKQQTRKEINNVA